MRLFEQNNEKIALHLEEGEVLSFQSLRSEIETAKRKKATPAQLLPLAAESKRNFVVNFLAALESSQPIALMNPQWTTEEREKREKLLQGDRHPKVALVLFTSGSGGSPKAVQLSAENIQANTEAVITSLDFHQVKSQMLFLPLHYSFGILGQLLPALKLGIPTTLATNFSRLLLDFATHPPQGMWSGVPSHWETLLRALPAQIETPELSHLVSAGAPFSVDLRRRLKARFPKATIYNNYGMTECSPRVLSYNSHHSKFLEEFVGFPVGDFKAQVTGEGELLLSGSQVMLGYLGDQAATNERIKNGWLYTGDAAALQEDGLVSLFGRLDDLVNIGGERLSLIEVENLLRTSPEIKDVAVGKKNHPIWGVTLVAFVVPADRSKWNSQSIMKWLSEKALPQKIPKEYQLLEEIPRLSSGKLDRTRLAEILKSM